MVSEFWPFGLALLFCALLIYCCTPSISQHLLRDATGYKVRSLYQPECLKLAHFKVTPSTKTSIILDASAQQGPKPRDAIKVSDVGALGYAAVTPLPDFDWHTTEPLKLRPFKPRYHLTMGLETITASDLIQIDENYLDRIALRKRILADHPETVLAANAAVQPAVNELYTWFMTTYLPTRFPRLFVLTSRTNKPNPTHLRNTATHDLYPLTPPPSALSALRILGSAIEDDLLFLLPSPDGDGYTLQGFVTCFPSGFDTSRKFGLKLREIHAPVPGYAEKLERSMDRWFERLGVGTFVRRRNWSITTHANLFSPTGTHLYENDLPPSTDQEIDIPKTHLRTELQTVHRLPQTKAILFAFHTFLYPLSQIKEEGLGDELAQAIEGLKEGSVPRMWWYKRAVVWGEVVRGFLRR